MQYGILTETEQNVLQLLLLLANIHHNALSAVSTVCIRKQECRINGESTGHCAVAVSSGIG